MLCVCITKLRDNLAATNFPDHRGTATSFPLAAFGLSAFVFSSIASLVLKGDISDFLLLLSLGTSIVILVSSIFLRVIHPRSSYSALPHHETGDGSSSQGVGRSQSIEHHRHPYGADETGTLNSAFTPQFQTHVRSESASSSRGSASAGPNADPDETSSLVSKNVSPRDSEDRSHEAVLTAGMQNGSHYPDLRGWALLSKLEFWQQFLAMGLLSGIGLMTIKLVASLRLNLYFLADC
jgi:hypothetical protein